MAEKKESGLVSQVFSAVIAVLNTVGTVYGWLTSQKWFYLILAIIFGVLTVVIFIFILFHLITSEKRHDWVFLRKIRYMFIRKREFKLCLRHTVLEFQDQEHIYHEKSFKIIPYTNHFNSFSDRYVFSGASKCNVRAAIQGQSISEEYPDHGWNCYTIKLDTCAIKKKPVDMKMKMDIIYDPNHTMDLFLSTGIYEPTERLIMEVKFPKGLDPRDAKLQVFKDYFDRNPIDQKPLLFDVNQRRLFVSIPYPVIHYKYLIRWCFS